MSPNFDFDLLNEAIENAPQVGFGPNVVFGKCLLSIFVTSYNREANKFNEVEWDGTSALQPGENFRFVFTVNVAEFNPALTREWVRRVDMRNSGRKSDGTTKNPKALADWEEIVKPSLIKTIGADWSKKLLKGVYVQIEEAETVVLDKSGNPKSFTTKPADGSEGKTYVNTAPRFVAAFKSKAECAAAREERFGKKNEDEAGEDEAGETVTKKMITEFKTLVSSLDNDVNQAIELADSNNLYPGFKGTVVAIASGFKPPF